MRALSPLIKKKRGLSNIVAYVLLISITISLSVMVYGWLRFYVSGEDIDSCSDKVNIIIRDYQCIDSDTGGNNRIFVTLKNKGLFTVDGFELRVHDREDAEFGFYLFDGNGSEIEPGEEKDYSYKFVDYPQDSDSDGIPDYILETVTILEVQPFIEEEGGNGSIRCKSHASQEINCN